MCIRDRDEANSATVSKRTEKFGLACPKRWGFESAAWRSPDNSEWVVVVGSRDHAKRRAVALKVAAHVEKTLGMKTGWAMCDAKCPASEKKKRFATSPATAWWARSSPSRYAARSGRF